ncbi:MAG TPA: carbohydrate binding family 9 domain-containing protein, partial [Candidatus Polarisedimenticolia bacterium]|nr:carbohydrate binding family 9 domain-containing protein [Candidatus Polarisedimenticolia bacterium]
MRDFDPESRFVAWMFTPQHPARGPRRFLLALSTLAAWSVSSWISPPRAEESLAPSPIPFQPMRTDSPPVLDGLLDESLWREAPVIDDFVQQLPVDKAPPTERTEVRLAYDAHNLYLGIRFFDSDPSGILAWTMQRDSEGILGDDQFAFSVDSSNNGRDGFWFSTNPAGVRNDSQVFDEGRIFDDRWDAVWEVATRVDDLGWTAEIKLPFFNLRFTPGAENTMGINFFRAIRRKNEEAYSPSIPRN